MQIPIYHVDAFTDRLFSGNPAAVCLLPHWLADDILWFPGAIPSKSPRITVNPYYQHIK